MRTLSTITIIGMLSACGGGTGTNTGAGPDPAPTSGSLSVGVTDGPIEVASAVVVSFSGLTIKPTEGDEISFEFDPALEIDLLALQGSAFESLIADESVPAGDYNWIRLAVNAEFDGIEDSYIDLPEGRLELRVPSGSQSGLRLNSGFSVAAGGSTDLAIDFDLRKSVTNPPGQEGALLKPSLRLIDNLTVGSLSGVVDSQLISDNCSDPSTDSGAVYVYEGSVDPAVDISGAETDPISTALVDELGNYEVGFLSGGEYSAAYTCDNGIDDPEIVDALVFHGLSMISISADSDATLDF